MRILAVVPARGGSKRLPGKNVRVLGGKPLIVWTIDVAKNNPDISNILVSTDDPVIGAVAETAGAFVPWLRPAALASDTATSVDVAIHALDWFEAEQGAVDALLLLQPTSPFRTRESVRRGIDLFKSRGMRPLVGVSPARDHPVWTFRIRDGVLEPFIKDQPSEQRSQDLPDAYVVNGCFYLISAADLRARRSFLGPETAPLVIHSPQEALDIDTEWDWRLAESVLPVKQYS